MLHIVLLGLYSHSYASENLQSINRAKDLFNKNYESFEKYVFGLQSSLWWGRKTGTIAWGAEKKGYDEFVINTCIPASYSFFDRSKKDIKNILKDINSQDNIVYVSQLLERCSENPQDINFIAHITYEEGKRLETEKINRGYEISAEDRDLFVGMGLFARFCSEKNLIVK